MSDIRKVSETRAKEEGDWDEWPYPTLTIESVVSGDLRSRILAKLGHAGDGCSVRLVERQVSGGYSKYTQEDDYSVEVWINGGTAWKHEYAYNQESAMAAFLHEFGEKEGK